MTGIIAQIIPKQRFDFTWLTMNAEKTIIIQSAINVVHYNYARIALRVHATSNLQSGQSIELAAFGTNPSADDPAEFTRATAVLTVSIDHNDSPPHLESASASDIDPFLKIALKFTQSATSGMPLWAELSADLILREN